MKIFLASPIADRAIDHLRRDHDVIDGVADEARWPGLLEDREALVFRSGVSISSDVMEMAPKLELAVRAGSGFDNIDLDHCRDRGIRVVRVPGPSSQAVAEFTLGLIMALSRRICEADAHLRAGRWPKHQLGGRLIAGKTLGVVGAGRIGKRVGEIGALLGMRVLACVERPAEESQLVLAAKGISLTDFDSVVTGADILSVHTPLSEVTRRLIDAFVIARMPQGAMLINTSRGGVVDEQAVLDALQSGHLSGAALDVHEQEGDGTYSALAARSDVVLTPHIGGMAIESQEMIGARAADIIAAHLVGDLDGEVTDEELLV
ncbi:hydroxyacid dehydrogenase [soil metagenome]